MPARRPPAKSFNAERFVQAITANQEDLYERFERKVDAATSTLEQSIRLVQQDVRLEGQSRKLLETELGAVQIQLGELRDAVHLQKRIESERAAREAARITAPVAAQATMKATAHRIMWPQWIAVVGVILMVLVTIAEKAPPTLRFMDATLKTWAGIKEK
jgi:hypothetical protein